MRIMVIFLGTTVAETSQKYGFTICSAGWSPTICSFVRIYPLPWPLDERMKAGRWEEYEFSVMKNPHDNRRESWKIDWTQPIDFISKWKPSDVHALVKPYRATSIHGLNDSSYWSAT